MEAALEAFTAERLLTLAADSVEISHEVLLTAWPLLRDSWLAETHADRIVRTRLHNVAAEWDRGSRDPSYLYSGSLLEAAAETAARIGADPARNAPLGQTEREFLHLSNLAHRHAIRRRHAVIAGLLVLTLTAVTAGGIAVLSAANATRQAANAIRQHHVALSRQLSAEGLVVDPADPMLARRLAVAAWRVSPTAQAASALAALLAEQQQNGILPADPSAVDGVAFSPGGKLLASADQDGTVRLWDLATDQPVGRPLQTSSTSGSGVNEVAFSLDGKLLASGGSDGTVRLWDPSTGRPVGAPMQADASAYPAVFGVAFSPDGKLLASADYDGTVRLWDPSTGHAVGSAIPAATGTSGGGVSGVAFSPDGERLASADDTGVISLWDVSPFEDPYLALCADVGPPTAQDWAQNAPGEQEPKVCG